MVKLDVVRIDIPEGTNVILGQSHFIKTVEDIYEALAPSSPRVKVRVGLLRGQR